MGLFDILTWPFGKEIKGALKPREVPLEPDKLTPQMRIGGEFADFISKYLPQYQPGKPYGGPLSAGISPQETRSMDFLTQYLNQPETPGQGFRLGSEELRKTFEDSYDPRTSTYYSGLRDEAARNTEEQIDTQRRRQAARGTFFTEGAARDEMRTRDVTSNYLTQILGNLYEKERDRRFQALPLALQYEQAEQGQRNVPLQKAAAGQQYGSLTRVLEQADYERRYREFQRQQGELGEVPGQALGYFGTPVTFGAKTQYGPSPFAEVMQAIGPIIQAGAKVASGGF